jgi:hypothetical protein
MLLMELSAPSECRKDPWPKRVREDEEACNLLETQLGHLSLKPVKRSGTDALNLDAFGFVRILGGRNHVDIPVFSEMINHSSESNRQRVSLRRKPIGDDE